MDSPSNWENAVRVKSWVCKKCGTENKGPDVECKSCGHQPTLGSFQHEQRRWNDSHREQE